MTAPKKPSVLDGLDMNAPPPSKPPKKFAEALLDKERLDWLSQGEDTGSSNLYDLWQCMLSHEPSKLREVIDYLRTHKKTRTRQP